MPNENCLKGISCPKCESEGPFNIRVSTMICVHDDGTDNEYRDLDWGDDSEIICRDCGHRGTVEEFRLNYEGHFKKIANQFAGDLADFQKEIVVQAGEEEWDSVQTTIDLLEEKIQQVRKILPRVRSIVEEIVTEFTRKEIREALKAHNSGKEDACFNEEYNKANGLGSMRARALIRSVIYCHNGLMSDRKTKITMREIEEFARNSLGDVKIV